MLQNHLWKNKANLRDLIAVTGLVILLKMDSYHWFFSPNDLEIKWMTSKNNRATLLGYTKLCALFQSHQWIQTGVRVRKRSIQVNIGNSSVLCEIWQMTFKNNRAPLLCYFKLCASYHSHRSIQTEVTVRKCQIRVKIGDFLSLVTLKLDGWYWKNNRAPPLCYFKLCALFHSHRSIQTGVTVRKPKFVSKSVIFFVTCDLEIW